MKSALTLTIAYCVGVLSVLGYQQIINPPILNLSSSSRNEAQQIYSQNPSLESQEEKRNALNQILSGMEQELAMVKTELKFLKDENEKMERKKQTDKQKMSERKKSLERRQTYLSSTEHKKNIALGQVISLNRELKGAIDLTNDQAVVLNNLLQEKVSADLERINSRSETCRDLSRQEAKACFNESVKELEENRRYFEEQLSYELDEMQLEKYVNFEKEKISQIHTQMMVYREADVLGLFDDLDDIQKAEITEFFNKTTAKLDDVKIGSYGTPYSRYNGWGFNTVDRNALKQYLEQVLTDEQYRHYSEQQKMQIR